MRVASQYPGWVIRITGPITAGDTGQLRSFQAQNDLIHCYEPGYCPFRNVLLGNSAGGDPAKDPEGVMNFKGMADVLCCVMRRFNRKAMILQVFQEDFEKEYAPVVLRDCGRPMGSPWAFCAWVDYRWLEMPACCKPC